MNQLFVELKLIIFFIIFLVQTYHLAGQKSQVSLYSFEFNYGKGFTGLHDEPVDLYHHSDADPVPLSQEQEVGKTFGISFFRRILKRQHLGLSYRYAEIIYFETGYVQNGWGPNFDYSQLDGYSFLNIGIVHKWEIIRKGPNLLSLENEVALAYNGLIHQKQRFFVPKFINNAPFEGANYQYTLSLQYGHLLTDWLCLQVGFYYSTALNDYSDVGFNPYSKGAIVGGMFRF